MVGSYFSTKMPWTNWTVCDKKGGSNSNVQCRSITRAAIATKIDVNRGSLRKSLRFRGHKRGKPTKALFPTPPDPSTTSLYSLISQSTVDLKTAMLLVLKVRNSHFHRNSRAVHDFTHLKHSLVVSSAVLNNNRQWFNAVCLPTHKSHRSSWGRTEEYTNGWVDVTPGFYI